MAERAQEGGYLCGVKIVRGAYMEKERERASEQGYASPIQPNKASSDRDFDAAIQWVLERIERVHLVAGSHNEDSNYMLCQKMSEMGLEPKDLELTDLIVEETRRIVKLLEQVEQFGNLREPIRQPVNLHDILDRVRRSALLGFGAHMTITDEYDPSLPPALGDIDQLMQVIMNLVKNAAEASPQGGTIRLRTYYEHSFRLRRSDSVGQALPLQVEVWDDGPGLPDEIKNDIFDPFVSGRENGTGLGLALASKIISDHGGWISVNSVPGRTVFRMSLPMATTQKGA